MPEDDFEDMDEIMEIATQNMKRGQALLEAKLDNATPQEMMQLMAILASRLSTKH